MRKIAPMVEEAVRRIQMHEAEINESSSTLVALRVCEKIRLYLSKLVGIEGFQSLLGRALTLTKEDFHWLPEVQVRPDATLEGFEEAALKQSSNEMERAGVSLLSHLLGLLATFIGGDLTLRLVKDIWPEAQLDDLNFNAEETP